MAKVWLTTIPNIEVHSNICLDGELSGAVAASLPLTTRGRRNQNSRTWAAPSIMWAAATNPIQLDRASQTTDWMLEKPYR